mgnify:CR=1 FL=1
MFFGFSAFIKKSIGLKKIPPPIPITPEIRPNNPPIDMEIGIGIFLYFLSLLLKELNFNNNKMPEIDKIKKSSISNNCLSIGKEPPIKAIGIDPIKYGVNNFKLRLPARI